MENDETKSPELEQDVNKNQEDYQDENQNDENQDNQNQEDSKSNDDETDWKAEALKYKAILDRNKNRKPETKIASKKSDELDYGQKAFLIANDIKGSVEFDLVKNFMKETGKSMEDVIEGRYFQEELKDLREKVATKKATPTSNKRTNNSSTSEVDYWINKGELPPETQVELRRKVVNEKIKRETKTNIFL